MFTQSSARSDAANRRLLEHSAAELRRIAPRGVQGAAHRQVTCGLADLLGLIGCHLHDVHPEVLDRAVEVSQRLKRELEG